MILLVRQWIRSDQREQARLDRSADRAEATGEADDLARYNAFLAAAGTDRGTGRRAVAPEDGPDDVRGQPGTS